MTTSEQPAMGVLRRTQYPNVSYWQIGHDDGYAGRPKSLPNPDVPAPQWNPANVGYSNGYGIGEAKRLAEA